MEKKITFLTNYQASLFNEDSIPMLMSGDGSSLLQLARNVSLLQTGRGTGYTAIHSLKARWQPLSSARPS